MALYRMTDDHLDPVPATRFADEAVRERADLQRLLATHIDVILTPAPGSKASGSRPSVTTADDPALTSGGTSGGGLVLAEEFGDWEGSQRRIDLLCLDADANLVVVELKRGEKGGHMDLQALRYAALVHRMTFRQAVQTHAKYRDLPYIEAEETLLDFLGWEEPDESADFSKELATSVLYLNEQANLDITCVRLHPHRLGDELLLDVQRVIPLEETSDYLIRIKDKARAAQDQDASFEESEARVPTIRTSGGGDGGRGGVWFVNTGDQNTVFRAWSDQRRYGFLQAGGGLRWSKQIRRVPEGAIVLAYASGQGYVGVGRVVGPAALIAHFIPPPPPPPPEVSQAVIDDALGEADPSVSLHLPPVHDAPSARPLDKWGPLHADLPRHPPDVRLLDLDLVASPNPDTFEDEVKGDWCLPVQWLATRDRDDGIREDFRRPTACEIHQPALVHRVLEAFGLDPDKVLSRGQESPEDEGSS